MINYIANLGSKFFSGNWISTRNLETTIADVEFYLSGCAAVPVLGMIPAALKACLGIIQTIGGVLGSIYYRYTGDTKGLQRASSHIVNGLANTGGAVLEALPFVGTAMFVYRVWKREVGLKYRGSRFDTGQEHMLLVGYRTLHDQAEQIAPLDYDNWDEAEACKHTASPRFLV